LNIKKLNSFSDMYTRQFRQCESKKDVLAILNKVG